MRRSSTRTKTRSASPVMSAKKLTAIVAHTSGFNRKPPARTATLSICDSMIDIVPTTLPGLNRASPQYDPENPETVSGSNGSTDQGFGWTEEPKAQTSA